MKDQVSKLFKVLGMDLSTATRIFCRQTLRCHGLPFEVRPDEPNETTYATVMEAAEKGENMYQCHQVRPFPEIAPFVPSFVEKKGDIF